MAINPNCNISLNVINTAVSSLQSEQSGHLYSKKLFFHCPFFSFHQNYQYLHSKFLVIFSFLKETSVMKGDNFTNDVFTCFLIITCDYLAAYFWKLCTVFVHKFHD